MQSRRFRIFDPPFANYKSGPTQWGTTRMVSHQLGIERDKAAFSEMAAQMMASTALSFDRQRCLYENDDILVEHSFMTLPDGSREAVMAVWTKLEGKLLQVETGATPISN